MKRFVYVDAFRYHCFNLIFIVMNFLLVRFSYNMGSYGEVSEDLDEIMQLFMVETVFNPIDLLFIVLLGIAAYTMYKRNPQKEICIDWKMYRAIFLSIILIGTVLLALLYTIRNEGGSILIALLLIFFNPMLFNYCYVGYCRQSAKEPVMML